MVLLEQVAQIAEVGAGIQMAPNSARILGRFGLLEKIMDKSNVLKKNSLRRWQDNRILGSAPLMPEVCATSCGVWQDTDCNIRSVRDTTHLFQSSTEAIFKASSFKGQKM